MKYLGLIDEIICAFLGDLKSLRVWLIIWAFLFNIYLIEKHQSDSIVLAGIGLLAGIYGAFFHSKYIEHKQN